MVLLRDLYARSRFILVGMIPLLIGVALLLYPLLLAPKPQE